MDVEELIEATDILEYISQFADFTEKNGEFWALSPLKEENTPSFSVNTELQSFYDFSSGKGGNVLWFIRCYNRCSRRRAEEILREYVGDTGVKPRRRHMEAAKVAERFARSKKQPKQSTAPFLPDDYMNRFEENEEKLAVWEAEGISASSLARFQVRYDKFSDRLVYPIRSPSGRIINVSGRTLDPEWKDKGLRKYTYFHPLGILDTLYGLSENMEEIMDRREIILFEGAKSVMLADTWGVKNTAAILTSHLNPHQLDILITLRCRVVFALDEDVDIREDANIQRLKHFTDIEYICDKDKLLEPKMSPVDAGQDVWETLYEGRLCYR